MTNFSKLCSDHFKREDFIIFDTKMRRLRKGVLPSVFSWTKTGSERKSFARLQEKKRKIQISEEEKTETASEKEEETECGSGISKQVQVNIGLPCSHRFGMEVLKQMCGSGVKEAKYLKHLTGFKSIDMLQTVLNFILPNADRTSIIYWNTKTAKKTRINLSFEDASDDEEPAGVDDDESSSAYTNANHILSAEDEFLLVLMKLRLGSRFIHAVSNI